MITRPRASETRDGGWAYARELLLSTRTYLSSAYGGLSPRFLDRSKVGEGAG